jgi:hypothetical protein
LPDIESGLSHDLSHLSAMKVFFFFMLWKLIFNVSSQLDRNTEQERPAPFVSDVGKYFRAV